MDNLVFKQERLNEKDTYDVLSRFDTMFSPSLSTKVDIASYSKKLSQNASWILCRHNNSIVGYIAYYQNTGTKIDYIPSVCVMDIYRSYHIASRMLSYMIGRAPLEIEEIKLECRKNNDAALHFYYKNGFQVISESDDMFLMSKIIRKI